MRRLRESICFVFGVLVLLTLTSLPSVAGVEKLLGKWVNISNSNDRVYVQRNGDVYEVLFLNRDVIQNRRAAVYRNGMLVIESGVGQCTFYYDTGSGHLITNNFLGSTTLKRITPEIAKKLAVQDAAYHKELERQRRQKQIEQQQEQAREREKEARRKVQRAKDEHAAFLHKVFNEDYKSLSKLKEDIKAHPELVNMSYTQWCGWGTGPEFDNTFTLLCKAVNVGSGGSPEAVAYLLSNGANPRYVDSSGCTPLHHADSRPVIDLLLAYGADIDAQIVKAVNRNSETVGDTALIGCARSRDLPRAQLLLAYGADTKIAGCYGRTALDWAEHDMGIRSTTSPEMAALIRKYASGKGERKPLPSKGVSGKQYTAQPSGGSASKGSSQPSGIGRNGPSQVADSSPADGTIVAASASDLDKIKRYANNLSCFLCMCSAQEGEPPNVSIDVTNAPLLKALDTIATQAGVGIITDGTLPRSYCSLSVHGVTAMEALMALCRTQNMRWYSAYANLALDQDRWWPYKNIYTNKDLPSLLHNLKDPTLAVLCKDPKTNKRIVFIPSAGSDPLDIAAIPTKLQLKRFYVVCGAH